MLKQSGCVNWPVNDPRYRDTCEGGLWAALVVFAPWDSKWRSCCIDAQCPLGKHRDKNFIEPCNDNNPFAQIVLGSTNASLWDDEAGKYFQTSYQDLTELGKVIFDSIRQLYPSKYKVEIVTFLDT